MNNFSLMNFIEKEIIKDEESMDMIYFDLSKSLFYYGDNFRYPRDKRSSDNFNIRIFLYQFMINNFLLKLKIFTNSITGKQKDKIVLSNTYFDLTNDIVKLGFNVISPIWTSSGSIRSSILANYALLKQTEKIKRFLNRANFNQLISNTFLNYTKLYQRKLKNFYSKYDIRGLIVPYDVPFFENLHIKIFRDLKIPSFIFLHGLPGRYNKLDDNRTDYLIVWGDLIKQFYMKYGIEEKKIIVAGHPYYNNFNQKNLRFDLKNILILTKGIPGALQRGKKGYTYRKYNALLYLYKIEKVLKDLNVKNVRFRPHPSENPRWYLKYININFYRIDNESLVDSLKNSTLVIGPSSTVLLEAVYYGVNYIVFEPSENNKNIHNEEIVPPFEGSIEGVPVAKNEEELKTILKNEEIFDINLFNKFIKPKFDISFLKDLI